MPTKKFLLRERLYSFVHAFNGLKVLFREEHNARIHLFFAIIACISGLFFHISRGEWMALLLAIGFVFCAESINSALENLADFVSPEKHEKIKKCKDLGAASVLISALTALCIGLCIFIPKLVCLIKLL